MFVFMDWLQVAVQIDMIYFTLFDLSCTGKFSLKTYVKFAFNQSCYTREIEVMELFETTFVV